MELNGQTLFRLETFVESHGESSITEVEDQPLGLLTNALTRIGWFSLFG